MLFKFVLYKFFVVRFVLVRIVFLRFMFFWVVNIIEFWGRENLYLNSKVWYIFLKEISGIFFVLEWLFLLICIIICLVLLFLSGRLNLIWYLFILFRMMFFGNGVFLLGIVFFNVLVIVFINFWYCVLFFWCILL